MSTQQSSELQELKSLISNSFNNLDRQFCDRFNELRLEIDAL
jgi:hypothetical protein